MSSTTAGDVGRHLRQLFDAGSAVGLTDGQLLEQFARSRKGQPDLAEAEAAFEAILARHGATVLSVCRQVLGDGHAAEDAFQATFLVLARKATTIRRAASLTCWLHGVAYRVALDRRKREARRRARERQAATSEATTGTADAGVAELRVVIDEELGRLPEKYRMPLVLHYLEGRSKEETARVLGWTEGTVSGRLARARDLLRIRLTRRGLAFTSGALAAALAQDVASAGVSPAFAASTVRLASLYTAGEAGVAAESAQIVALTERVVRTMFLTKLKLATAVLLVAAITVVGMAGLIYRADADPSGNPQQRVAPVAAAGPKAPPAAVDGKEHKPLLSVPLPDRTMLTMALSAQGKRLAIAPQNGTVIQLWDVATGKEKTLKGHAFSVIALAFSPDGKTLASATGSWLPDGAPGEIKLWEVATGTERASLARLPKMVLALAFSPDGKTLASVSETVKLWDVMAQKESANLPIKAPNSVAFAPDNKTLAVGSGVREDKTPGSVELCVGFTPDGKTLASGDSRGTLKLWDTATNKERATVPPPAEAHGSFWFQSFAFPADSKTVVGTMMLYWPREERSALVLKEWDAADGKERATYPAKAKADVKDSPMVVSGDGSIVGLASPAGEALLVAPDGKLELWERRSLGTKLPKLPPDPQDPPAGKPLQQQADDAKAAAEKELNQLKGVWISVGYEKDGEQHAGDQVREALWNERLWFNVSTPVGDWLRLNWERKGPGRQTASAAVVHLGGQGPAGAQSPPQGDAIRNSRH
jgi:RNA polymerase sigma factor (sigma-70 family)